MEKMTVFYESIRKGKSKKTEQPYQMASFFQIVQNRWGTSKVDVIFSPSDEVYAQLESFIKEHECIVGDLVEISLKMSKDLTRPPKLTGIIRVVEKSPLLKYVVVDEDNDFDDEDLTDEIPQFVKVGEKK